MKKLIFILIPLLFTGCVCTLGQIPPQTIYAGAGCSALLPDYRTRITVSDNCEIASLIQTPLPGYILDATNKIADVVLKASDASGNERQLKFTVMLIDTIKPVFVVDTTLFGYSVVKFTEFYDLADSYVKQIKDSSFNEKWLVVASRNDISGFRERVIFMKDSIQIPF